MNRITKIVFGAGAFLCMSGGLLALTGWAAGADTQAMRDVGVFPHSYSVSGSSGESAPDGGAGYLEDMDLEPFTKLDVDLSLGDVTVMTGDSYGVILDWSGRNYSLSCEPDGDTLHVRSSQSVNLNLAGHSASVTVYLPEHAELEEADVHTSLGDAYLDNVRARQMKAASDLGDVSLYHTSAGELDVTCSMGNIWLDGVTAGDAELTNSMGDISAEGLSVERSLDVEASMGDIDLQGDLRGETDIEASMGNVALRLSQEEQSYSYELDVSMGQLTVNGQAMPKPASRTGGPHRLEVENHMGDIELTFGY